MDGPNPRARSSRSSRGARFDVRPRGFTLVDVLVTMAVVALLIGILLPGLAKVRESSRRVVCASNLRQVGLGLALYADNSRDSLPYSVFIDARQQAENQIDYSPESMMTLRVKPNIGRRSGTNWDGLGLLYSQEVLPDAEIFYCPSHHGEHDYDAQETTWRKLRGELVGNYHYRGQGPNGSTRLTFIEPSRAAIAADGLRAIDDYNHLVGLNVLRADLSLFWLSDPLGRISDYLVARESTDTFKFDVLWDQLDTPEETVLPQK